jgi:hypothetical protein
MRSASCVNFGLGVIGQKLELVEKNQMGFSSLGRLTLRERFWG